MTYIKQLPVLEDVNFFAIAQFHINPQEGEISHIYKFRRVSDRWENTDEDTFTQETELGHKEILKNCFQIRHNDLDQFLHFTEEHMTVLNAETGYSIRRVNYMKAISNSLE